MKSVSEPMMDYQMEESSRLADGSSSQRQRQGQYEFGDDECSTDSGCSSGGSTGSAERLSRQSSGDRLCESGRLAAAKSHCYLDRLRGRSTFTREQERLCRKPSANERVRSRCSKSWSPENSRLHSCMESPLHSQSPSDTHSSDSETNSQVNTFNSLFKVFQGLKISNRMDTAEKKHSKKSPKRILRAPVSYTYVRGLSGLPTQRVPRNSAQICSCHEFNGLY